MNDADFLPVDQAQAELGRLLFHDPILSGNRNIACATCHAPAFGGGDGLSLGLGEGGVGLGPGRVAGTGPGRARQRQARHAPALWNLGHRDITALFHDGRLELTAEGIKPPRGVVLPQDVPDIVAAQALLPMAAAREMAGDQGENPVADAVATSGPAAGWAIIAARVRDVPAYADRFAAAFPQVDQPERINITEIVAALSAHIRHSWRSYDSPFDAHLGGKLDAMPPEAQRGMALFYGEAGCATCHYGELFTDQSYHALGLPQFGPGRVRRFDPVPRDVGRISASDHPRDAYRFRTPSLRNVALTAPYGHNGAYPTLEGMIRHHLNPLAARRAWRPEMAQLPSLPETVDVDFILQMDDMEQARQEAAISIAPRDLGDGAVADLVAFLESLTGATAQVYTLPTDVPSGLPPQ